ncbi:MAG: DUF4191 domain-containing protein [Propionibacteriaceae bacterium]|jgi:hypothetical protein|nr:DUF4191 domain-containing protein [Propionibacteriaceae bacterium]
MARSERAKQLEAEQKAAAQAEKLRKKQSNNPDDWGRVRQIVETFKMTRQHDKPMLWLVLGSAVASLAVGVVVGLAVGPLWAWLPMGIMLAALSAMTVLAWRARLAAYKRFDGQPGSAEVAMNLLPKKWLKSPAISLTRYQDVVHRVVGPPGIVLIGEGQAGRVRQLLATETKKHESVRQGVPVTTVVVGKESNQVPLNRLNRHLRQLPKAVRQSQVSELQSRLKALDAARPKMPLPRGPLPTNVKGARQALRGH